MPKFKTYVTRSGFFELAIAAPSMKAALAALGVPVQFFKKGFASETVDRAVVLATAAKPGVVLKRAVGSKGKFTEHAALPVIKAGKAASKETGAKTHPRGAAKSGQSAFARKKVEAGHKRELAKFMRVKARHDAVLAKLDEEAANLARRRALEEDQWTKAKRGLSKPEDTG